MEFTIATASLLKTLNLMSNIVQKKSTMPILANIKLSIATNDLNSQLQCYATDLDIGMQMNIECQAITAGSITVQAKALLDIVRVLPGPDVFIKVLPNNHVQIKSGKTQAKLVALPADEFPKMVNADGMKFNNINKSLFANMIEKTLYSCSVDENRYSLTGVYLENSESHCGKLTLISTDGHRLSRIQQNFGNTPISIKKSVILPRKGLGELAKLLNDTTEESEADFQLAISDKQAIALLGHTTLSMRLIDGEFPDYQQVIPKLSDKLLRASRSDFITSLKRVSVLASDRNQGAKLITQSGDVIVSCINPDFGEVTDDVPVDYNGPDIEIGFNVRYLIDALASISDQNVLFKFTDSLSPSLLVGASEDNHICVIMPMRI